jgi:aryl-alcohol dehydrogenase-like predicted oxidoreductase
MSIQNGLRRKLGPDGPECSAIGLGTWAIGGQGWGGSDAEQAVAAIQASIDEGIDLIDTAPIYGFGHSEEIVGRAIRGRRDRVVLATKCGLVWGGEGGDFFFDSAQGPVRRFLGPASIRREVEASLKRLGTDRIDLYQTHWQETTTPIADTMGALLECQRAGKIRAIGVSNANPAQLAEYLAAGPIASAQEIYSMLDRELAATLFPLCARHGVAVLAYSPLAMGLLTGRMQPAQSFQPGDNRGESPRFSTAAITAVNAFLATLQPIAQAHGITLAQLVIAWTLQQPGVTHALCGARTPLQARENAAAGRVHLTPDELRTITHRLDAARLKIPKVFE